MILWFLINSENSICFFVCFAIPVFERWEKNIQIIKKIKNIDSFDFLINSENSCFLYVLPFQSFEAEKKIFKESKKSKIVILFIFWLILKIFAFCLCCLTSIWKLRENYSTRNVKSKQIVDRPIANGKIHGINLHPGVENLGNGNCALECVLDSINTRECFQESYDGTPDHFCLI